VGVHIADVSYFVKPGTALDTAARERGTSVYLVQRVLPMLPHLLCEQLCSLNPGAAPPVFFAAQSDRFCESSKVHSHCLCYEGLFFSRPAVYVRILVSITCAYVTSAHVGRFPSSVAFPSSVLWTLVLSVKEEWVRMCMHAFVVKCILSQSMHLMCNVVHARAGASRSDFAHIIF
jgi:hypothetical protein